MVVSGCWLWLWLLWWRLLRVLGALVVVVVVEGDGDGGGWRYADGKVLGSRSKPFMDRFGAARVNVWDMYCAAGGAPDRTC